MSGMPSRAASARTLRYCSKSALLRGGADVEGVADSVGAEPDGVLDGRVQRRERASVRGDLGLAVELEDERHLAGVLPVELLGQADLQRRCR